VPCPPPIRRWTAAALLAASLIGMVTWATTGVARAAAYVPHEVIVGYSRAVPASVAPDLHRQEPGRATVSAAGSEIRVVHLPRGESVPAAIASLRRRAGVEFAEPDFIAHAAGGWYPNDRGLTHRAGGWQAMQWNFLAGVGVNAPMAWANLRADHRPGGRGVIVAILDTGVAYRNWRQFRESPDFKGTRFVAPHDFVDNSRYPVDRNGHGTFVADVVAEATNNRIGLTGLAYGASIMPVRVLDASGQGSETTIARGIRYAVNHGAEVINLSLEFSPGEVSSAAEIPNIIRAIGFAHSHGVVVVGAAGNDQTSEIAYPAREPSVISVGATTRDRCLANYSNGGLGLDLVAPGGGNDALLPGDPDCHPDRNLPAIRQLSLVDPPRWGRFGYPNDEIGTSMSAPEVAATAALVIASRVIGPRPSPDQILARLEHTAVELGGSQPSENYGYGLLDAGAATASS
jgi:serine protease